MSVAPTASSNIARERESATVAATPPSQFLRESASSPILLHGATPRLLICAGSFFTKRGSEIATGYDARPIGSDAASSGAGARGRESSSRSIRPGRRAIGLSALGIGRDWQTISLDAQAIGAGCAGIQSGCQAIKPAAPTISPTVRGITASRRAITSSARSISPDCPAISSDCPAREALGSGREALGCGQAVAESCFVKNCSNIANCPFETTAVFFEPRMDTNAQKWIEDAAMSRRSSFLHPIRVRSCPFMVALHLSHCP